MSKTPQQEISEFVETEHSIECEGCGNGSLSSDKTPLGAAEDFFSEGWRIIDDEPKCPECAA